LEAESRAARDGYGDGVALALVFDEAGEVLMYGFFWDSWDDWIFWKGSKA
jgi:hypothetical protein